MGALAAQQATASLKEYAERYITKRTVDGASEKTVLIYRAWLTHPVVEGKRSHPGGIAAHVPDVASLDSRTVAAYFTALRDRGLAASSRSQAHRTVKAFVAWLEKRSVHGPLPQGDPMEDVEVAVPRTLPTVPKAEDVQAVLDACERHSLSGLRNRALILAMADSLLRRQEALNLRVCDYERGDKATPPRFQIRRGKGNKDRMASVGEETAYALRKYLDEREGHGPLDPLFAAAGSGERLTGRGVAQILHRLCDRAKLPRERWLHPHALRHWGATAWLRSGVGLESLRLQLGHSSLAVTSKYLHLVPDDVQREHMRASPLSRLGIRVK